MTRIVRLMTRPCPNGKLPSQLKQLFPVATSFSPKEPAPQHFKAYITHAGGAPPGQHELTTRGSIHAP
ncbi:MAG: hypothetical protein ABL961_01215 [Vicinamibacterales bacterium]